MLRRIVAGNIGFFEPAAAAPLDHPPRILNPAHNTAVGLRGQGDRVRVRQFLAQSRSDTRRNKRTARTRA